MPSFGRDGSHLATVRKSKQADITPNRFPAPAGPAGEEG